MAKAHRKITFIIEKKMWEDFSIKAIKEGRSKTEILKELIGKYLK